MSEGRAPRRCHSDRGILEQYDGKFIKARCWPCLLTGLDALRLDYRTRTYVRRSSLASRNRRNSLFYGAVACPDTRACHLWMLVSYPRDVPPALFACTRRCKSTSSDTFRLWVWPCWCFMASASDRKGIRG